MSHKKASPSQSDFDEEVNFGPLFGQDKKPYTVFESEIRIREISFYISDDFGDPIDYAEMCHVIRNAGEMDRIRLHLNTRGGNVGTGIQIINAIRESSATVTTVLDGEAYSMGAILFLSGDQQAVGDHGQLMFHDYSSGLMGKGNEQRAAVLSAAKWFGKLMVNICSPFLSHEEIEDVLNGRDLWIDSDEVIERLTTIQKQREEEEKAAAKAAKDAEKLKSSAVKKTSARKPARKKAPARKATPRRKTGASSVEAEEAQAA